MTDPREVDELRAEVNFLCGLMAEGELENRTRDALRALVADNDGLRADVEALRQGLWDCFRVAGGDTDGDPTPRAITSPLVPLVLDCVTDLRSGYDELLDED